ncbi:MAG TPA: transglycosylase SLT domain-containing protein [Tahibacter sp.]|uniref:transglycosylase SLT domain-containing protein n=1 Tax=Tahibacter sp. TaxID=2056211 RepID=UPI002CC6CD2E|nr:transglycosylase SLT domain-containing protein [Tahibacter sp.]HSX60248.1 transglycosylase SLT domain-containing protein [Tahibacter sp.]
MTRKVITVLRTLALIVIVAALLHECAIAAPPSAAVSVPAASARYRIALEREVAANFGVAAPTARVAAQIHQESIWRPAAKSAYAIGLSQFTVPTAEWLPTVCPSVGPPDPWDADWSIRAIACYDAWIYKRVRAATECDRWAFVLSAYNGGIGWIPRDRALAVADGADPMLWWGHVEHYSTRAKHHMKENRSYPRRILWLLEPAYIRAGWPGAAVCT